MHGCSSIQQAQLFGKKRYVGIDVGPASAQTNMKAKTQAGGENHHSRDVRDLLDNVEELGNDLEGEGEYKHSEMGPTNSWLARVRLTEV